MTIGRVMVFSLRKRYHTSRVWYKLAACRESTILSCIMREKSLRFAEPLKCKVRWTLHAAKTLARCNARTTGSTFALSSRERFSAFCYFVLLFVVFS